MKLPIFLSVFLFAFVSFARADGCTVDFFKTYIPRGPERPICEGNLPATWPDRFAAVSASVQKLGYDVTPFDQCRGGTASSKAEYRLASQLGDCVEMGFFMSCKLWAALIRNSDDKIIYQDTLSGTGFGAVNLYLSELVKNMPSCAEIQGKGR